MPVPGVSNTEYDIEPSDYSSNKAQGKSALGKNEFLNLLVTQLANQDPMNPAEDTEFIAQMAQFTSLEQMQNLNDSFSTFKAFSLVGKNVQGTVGTEKVEGYVESVRIVDGVAYATVDGNNVEVDKIKKVTDVAEELQVLVGILEQLNASNTNTKTVLEKLNAISAPAVNEVGEPADEEPEAEGDDDTTVGEVPENTDETPGEVINEEASEAAGTSEVTDEAGETTDTNEIVNEG